MVLNPIVKLKDSITIQLLKVVFSFYFVLTIIMTITHMTAEFLDTKANVTRQLEVIGNNFEPGLAHALWDMNLEQLQPTFLGMVQFPAVVGVKLENEEGEEVGASGMVTNQDGTVVMVDPEGRKTLVQGYTGIFVYSLPITFSRRGNEIPVGKATIYSSTSVVFDEVKLGFLFIIINSIIKTLVLWALFLWIARNMLSRPLAALTSATQNLQLDQLQNVKIDIKTKGRNELKVLEESFNAMSQKLYDDAKKIKGMTQIFQKFVPYQFLRRIAAEGIENIEVGKAESDTVTVLFSDIRNFTKLSETMSPQDLLNFLNVYFFRMNEPILQNQGFIDKFIGDAIMALFDRPQQSALDAVRAAIAMTKSLDLYNEAQAEMGRSPLSIGVGIHMGNVVFGTVGSDERMDSTVLGDTVNVCSRLEGLCKVYHSQIIISSEIYEQLNDDSILCRELDFVLVKGKDIPVRIYEVFNGNSEAIREKKKQITHWFHQGLSAYLEQQWEQAIEIFEQCLNIYPEDIPTQLYIERCQQFRLAPPAENWQGVTEMLHK